PGWRSPAWSGWAASSACIGGSVAVDGSIHSGFRQTARVLRAVSVAARARDAATPRRRAGANANRHACIRYAAHSHSPGFRMIHPSASNGPPRRSLTVWAIGGLIALIAVLAIGAVGSFLYYGIHVFNEQAHAAIRADPAVRAAL